MRIMMTTDAVGGVWDHTLALGEELGRRGHEVVAAVTGPSPSTDQHTEAAAAGVRLDCMPFPLEWMVQGDEPGKKTRRWLAQMAQRERPDVVHVNSFSHITPLFGVPVVLGVHSTMHGWWEARHPDREPPEGWEPYRKKVERALAMADAVVAPTHAMLEELRRVYGAIEGRTQAIPNGIRTGPAPGPSAQREDFVLGGGRLWDEGKGFGHLDRAAARVPWPVRVTGQLTGMRSSGWFRNLLVLGHLGRRDLQQTYRTAGLYVNPALYEPFGLGPLEAGTSGCPLVLSDLPSHREVWQDAARYVPPGDPEALADAVHHLIDDPEERHEQGARAAGQGARYSAHRMADAYETMYARTLGLVTEVTPCAG